MVIFFLFKKSDEKNLQTINFSLKKNISDQKKLPYKDVAWDCISLELH
jgi:hypothetical protein